MFSKLKDKLKDWTKKTKKESEKKIKKQLEEKLEKIQEEREQTEIKKAEEEQEEKKGFFKKLFSKEKVEEAPIEEKETIIETEKIEEEIKEEPIKETEKKIQITKKESVEEKIQETQKKKSFFEKILTGTIKNSEKNNIPCVLIDTAGRIHTATNLLREMEKIVKVCKPDTKIFVGESITGNDAIEQVKSFNDIIGIDGIILSKADIDEKGGTALSLGYTTKKPILYLGIGQEYNQIELFDKNKFLEKLGL